MKITLHFILFLLVFIPKAFAQKEFIYALDEGRTLDIEGQCLSLRVIDKRLNKENLGALRGRLNAVEPIVTEQPLDVYLPIAYKNMKVIQDKGHDELVMVLYSLEMQDRPNQEELATFYIDADFYRGSKNDYRFIATIDSMYEVRAVNYTRKILITLSKKKLSGIIKRNAVSFPVNNKSYDDDAMVNERLLQKKDYPIYNTNSYKTGIYYTVEQFLNNSPVDTGLIKKTYTRDGGKIVNYFYYKDANGKKGVRIKEDEFFSIYDGNNWWVSNIATCSIMKVVNNDFYATQYFQYPYSGSTGDEMGLLPLGFMFGGVVGLSVSSIVVSSMPERIDAKNVDWGLYTARFNPVLKQFRPVKRAEYYK